MSTMDAQRLRERLKEIAFVLSCESRGSSPERRAIEEILDILVGFVYSMETPSRDD